MDNANNIYSSHANHVVDLAYWHKWVGLRLNFLVVLALFYYCACIEHKAKIVFNAWKSEVCQLDLAIAESVHIVLF